MAEKVRAIDGREDRVFFVRDLEVRKDAQGKPIGVKGHAAVWEQRAWIGPPKYGFSEQFQNGAFTESVNGGADVRYLFNHNPDHVLARTKSGTLRLGNDTTGLTVDGDLAPTSVGRDLAILMERGDVDQMSVGMQVVEDRWEEVEGDDGNVYELRTIIRAKLFDVSAVTYPAYEQTDAGLRSADHARELRDARGVAVERRTIVSQGDVQSGAQMAAETSTEGRPATATAPDPAPAQGGTETPEGPAAGGVSTGNEGPATATPQTEERDLSLVALLRRHADGIHVEPRLSCPACNTRPATATG
jgi:HK97 family phage prohead protease